jgi:hypothetical protein
MTVTVTYQMISAYDPFYVISGKKEYQAREVMICKGNAESLVNEIAESIASDSEFWDYQFGETSTFECVGIEVFDPEGVRGFYDVTLNRIVKAYSIFGRDPRAPKGVA